MREFLNICGYKEDDLERELPRVRRAFDRMRITPEDIEVGKQRLHMYYDTSLVGIRRILRLLMNDVVDTVLARDKYKTVVYGFMSPGFTTIGSAIISGSRDVYATFLPHQFQFVMGSIFNKIIPVFEAAEAKWLKTGLVSHCGNVKTLVGLIAMDIVPKPDFIATSGYLCDTAPKTIDLIQDIYNIPACTYTAYQDRDIGEYDTATRRVCRVGANTLRRCIDKLENVVGFKITDQMLRQVRDAQNPFNVALGELQELIGNSDPMVLSANHQVLWFCLGSTTIRVDKMPEAVAAVEMLRAELQKRVDRGIGVIEKGAPRVLAMLPSHYTDPRLDYLAGQMGIAIAGIDLFPLKSNEAQPADLYEQITSENIGVSLEEIPKKRVSLIIEECKRLKVVGVINRYHVGCRSVAGDAMLIGEAVGKELGIPVMLVERDDFDPRICDYQQYKSNLEVFKTMLRKGN